MRRKREWKREKKGCLLNEPPADRKAKIIVLNWISSCIFLCFFIFYLFFFLFVFISTSNSTRCKMFVSSLFSLFSVLWSLSPFAAWYAEVRLYPSMKPLDFNYFHWEREWPRCVFWMRLFVLSVACCRFCCCRWCFCSRCSLVLASVPLDCVVCFTFHGFSLSSECNTSMRMLRT